MFILSVHSASTLELSIIPGIQAKSKSHNLSWKPILGTIYVWPLIIYLYFSLFGSIGISWTNILFAFKSLCLNDGYFDCIIAKVKIIWNFFELKII